ncbi:MAG TPA: CdaR family protein [Thermomicrobiales bacterium]|nr:CdaR family protein [Thermomicrobiales bacterium]
MNLRERLEGRVSKTDGIRLLSSLVLALLLWGWVTTSQDPERTKSFGNITIQAEQLNGDLEVSMSSLPTALVTLRGPQSVVDDVVANQITAHLNLSNIHDPGTYTVPVNVSVPDGIWSHSVIPNQLSIEVERTMTKQFHLDVQLQGTGSNPSRQVHVEPKNASEVTLRGPESDVKRVDKVVLRVDATNQTRSYTAEFTPVAIDSTGQEIPEVAIAPSTVTATVDISARGKSVAVITQLVGDPAQGYEVVDRQVIPSTVLVDGPQDSLNDLIAIQTEPIDITGVSGNIRRHVRLTGIPNGIQLIDPSDGFVDVVVQVRQRGVQQPLPGQSVTIENLGPGLTADVGPNEIVVNVVAPQDVLAQLPGSTIEVQVDAKGLGPGTYTVRPKVLLPPNVQWISTDPQTVTLTIEATAAATPAATAKSAPSPVATPAATPSPVGQRG